MKRKTRRTIERITSRSNVERGAAALATMAVLALVRRKLWYRHNAKPELHELDGTLLPQSHTATGGPEGEPYGTLRRTTVPGFIRGTGYGETPGI